jgi:hypothetical protein
VPSRKFPASQGIVPLTSNQSTGKIDYVLSEKQRLSGSYSFRHNTRLAGGTPRLPLPFTSQNIFNQNFKSYFFRLSG